MAVRAKNAEIRTITGNLSGNATSATTATNDTKGQAITSYIRALSISGRTITYTKGDGTTGTITTQDTNTTYTLAGLVGSTAIGSTTQPIYWDGSKFTTIGYTIAKSVPSNAVFTDVNVTQSAITASEYTNWRPLIWGASNSSTEGFTPSTTTGNVFTANTLSCQPSSGTIRATKFKGALEGNATSATTASKLGTATVGGTAKPIYLNAGTATALSATVGSTDTPVYLNAGTITSTGKSFSSYMPLAGGTITGDLTVNGSAKLNTLKSADASYKIKYAKFFSIDDLGITQTTSDPEGAKALLKALCSTYPGLQGFIFEGKLTPNSNAYYKVYIYDTSAVDSNGLPLHSFGEYHKYGNTDANDVNFGTTDYKYYFRGKITSHQDISGKQDKSTAVTHTANTAVGSATQPVYVASSGAATASTASVGSADIPVYMSNGTITASTKKFSDYLPLTGGTISGDIVVGMMDVKSFKTGAGGAKIGWVKILKAGLNSNNHIHGQNLIITLNRNYTEPSSESYTFSVNFGWMNANIVQLNGMAGHRIIEKFRAVRDDTNHKLYLEYYVNTSYTTYENIVNVTVIHSRNYSNFVGCNEVQTEADSALVILSTINTASSKIVGNLEGNATTATTASKLGTATVGGTAKPIYLNAGTATALSATVGSTDTPVYLNAGTITSTGKSFSSYMPLAGGTMTGNISFKGTSGATHTMIAFKSADNADGDGIIIGGGGLTVIGSGESAEIVASKCGGGDEPMYVASDEAIYFYSNMQNGWDARKTASFSATGVFSAPSFSGPLSGNATSASTLLNPGRLTTTAALDGFLEANRFKYATIGAISGLSGTYNNNDGMILSVGWENTSWGHQIYIDDSSYDIHHRYKKSSDGWQAWSKILDTSNYKSYCTPANIGAATTAVATTSANGLMSSTDKAKLDGIASGANAYTHPSHTAYSSGLYKVTVNALGHVTAATAVTKADITALGIPGSDTNTWRGVQDNLTSTATDQSLSANQGKLLKGLVDGKAAASHTHNYAGSSSAGGDATNALKLGGLSASTSATKSTIVARDSNNYVFFNYINSNTSNSENPTISQIIVTNGSDSYYRKASLAHLKSSLGSMPASDVYAWAKASTKPTYTASEVGAAAASHTHSGYAASDHTHSGYVATSGGAMTGALKVNCSNVGTDYTTYRFRNIGFGTTSTPTSDSTYGGNGAIYFMYS